jgi:4-methylaminobutanoate oxidase (formaldehyde-forming)
VGSAASTVEAARISYAGELGWELTVDADAAVGVWDALLAGGRDHGLEPFGYRALDGLRMEKGYRYYSVDMTMLDTPYEAGLGAFVRLGKGDFVGRAALREAHEAPPSGSDRRLSTILIGADDTYLPIYGGEAVRADGEVIGRLRSVARGPVVARTIGYVYRARDLSEDARLTVDVFDERVTATLAPDVPWDPSGDRMRG